MRPTLRARVTAVFAGLFIAAGALLLTVNYVLVKRSIDRPIGVLIAEPGPFAPQVLPAPSALRDLAEARRAEIRRTLQELVVRSTQALAILAVAAGGLGWLVAGQLVQPIQRITATARRLSERNLDERIELDGPDDELKELADTFDALLGRLDAAFEAQRRFVGNASHELRTPLAVMRTEVDVTLADPDPSPADLRAMGERVRDAVDRAERLIDSLLVLARSDRGLARTEPLDLADVARQAAAAATNPAAARRITFETDLRWAPVRGDAALLARLAANLVDNAVLHGASPGAVRLATDTAGAVARLVVVNDGPVIPADRAPELFEPFRRLERDRTASDHGVGLGLSIVRSVAAAHGGTASATARPSGGLEVVVTVPARDAAATSTAPDG